MELSLRLDRPWDSHRSYHLRLAERSIRRRAVAWVRSLCEVIRDSLTMNWEIIVFSYSTGRGSMFNGISCHLGVDCWYQLISDIFVILMVRSSESISLHSRGGLTIELSEHVSHRKAFGPSPEHCLLCDSSLPRDSFHNPPEWLYSHVLTKWGTESFWWITW
jgi:hypothetical protein